MLRLSSYPSPEYLIDAASPTAQSATGCRRAGRRRLTLATACRTSSTPARASGSGRSPAARSCRRAGRKRGTRAPGCPTSSTWPRGSGLGAPQPQRCRCGYAPAACCETPPYGVAARVHAAVHGRI